MPHLILVRHGQSEWNLEKRFTGWVDVDLTGQGKLEACKSGECIKELKLNIDYFFSVLLTCLYQRYLSSKIEQLLDVFWGMEEQAEIEIIIVIKKNLLNLNISIFNLIDNNCK